MKPILFAIVTCTPIVAFAGPDDDDDDRAATGMLVDCSKAKPGDQTITESHVNITFSGTCGKIKVTGSENHIRLEKAASISLKGDHNTVDAAAIDAIAVAGNENTVGWKKGVTKAKPTVSVSGKENKVAQVK